MLRRLPFLALPLLLGCSSVYDATGKTALGADGPHVYGGLRAIFSGDGFVGDYGKMGVFQSFQGTGFSGADGLAGALGAVLVAPVFADVAFSLVTDTLLLPFSLSRSERSRRWW